MMLQALRIRFQRALRILGPRQAVGLFVALGLVALGAISATELIEKRQRETLSNTLNTVLEGAHQAVQVWARDHRLAALNFAQSETVVAAAQYLLWEGGNREDLLTSPSQEELRRFFLPQLRSGQYRGFFIIGPGDINLASSRDANVGSPNLLTRQPDVLARLWAGHPAMSRILFTDVPLTEFNQPHHDETMFVGAPITDVDGKVIALLTLRIDPYATLFPLMEQGRLGSSGESYAFDRGGMMITASRFEKQLQQIGLLAPVPENLSPEEREAYRLHQIRLSDPGVDLTRPGASPVVAQRLPLTVMAASATRGERGINVDGYRDYRGVKVVGAWLWNDEYDFGIATEQNVAEAYGLFNFVRAMIYGGSLFSTLILLFLAYIFVQGRQDAQESQQRLKAVVNTALDGVVIIDKFGIIESVNPAMEMMFGYPWQEMVGKNIKMLMPQPYHDEHDGYLSRSRITGKARVIGVGREVEAKRANGEVFPIDLSVSRLELESGLRFAGLIRDISHRRSIEKALVQERRFTGNILDALTAQIAVLDGDGRIVFANRPWNQFARDLGLEAEAVGPGQDYLSIIENILQVDGETVARMGDKLHAILEGELENFRLEYPLNHEGKTRWFELRATRFTQSGKLDVVMSHLDITARIKAEQRLQEEKDAVGQVNRVLAVTESALERTGLAEMWVAPDLRVIRVTDQACRHLGYSREELLDMRVPDFDPNVFSPAIQRNLRLVDEQGWGRFESIHLTKDGRRLPVEVTAVHEPAGILGDDFYITFVTEITQRKEAEAELIQARKAAEEANRAKSTFLATMSHEIRTPLNGVVGTIDMLAYTGLEQNQKDLVNTARDSAVMLQGVIDDILDFSKIEAGRLELEQIGIPLGGLLESLSENLQHLALKQGVELLIYCDPALPEVIGDPVRLRQILFNLTGNAIKFSSQLPDRQGRVFIGIFTGEWEEPGGIPVVFRVSDNGIGMNAEVQKRLFNSFVQAEGDTTRRFGGTGLGLAITQRLVKMMHGQISVDSEEDIGSTFEVLLSLEKSREDGPDELPLLTGVPILLLTMDENPRLIMESYLRHEGAEVVAVHPAQAQEEYLAMDGENAVVIMDMGVNDNIAIPLREAVRREAQGGEMRLITMERGRRRYARAHRYGGMTVDLNAMHRDTFVNMVAAVAGRESLQRPDGRSHEAIFVSPPRREEAERAGRMILLADDNETNQKVIEAQLHMLGYAVEVAADGEEALAMWERGSHNLVLTDCHMPLMDGYELTRQIRCQESDGKRLPILAITADAMKGTAQKCFAAGMDDYITKPVQLTQLRRLLEKWLSPITEPSEKVFIQKPEAAAEVETEVPEQAVDPQALSEVLGADDPALLADYYLDFLGTSAVTKTEIEAAHAEKDALEIGRLAHKMKSSSRTIGAGQLADCCLSLEMAGREEDMGAIDYHMSHFSELFEQVRLWIEGYQEQLSRV